LKLGSWIFLNEAVRRNLEFGIELEKIEEEGGKREEENQNHGR
jgi:hypothetical protein